MIRLRSLAQRLSPFIHPLLFATYPVLALLAHNIGRLGPEAAGRPLLVALGLALLVLFVVRLIVCDGHRAAILASAFLVQFLSYGHFYWELRDQLHEGFPLLRHRVLLPLWALTYLAIAWWIGRRLRNPAIWTGFLNLVAVLALLWPTYTIASAAANTIRIPGVNRAEHKSIAMSTGIVAGNRPDIYYIILDGYTRADVLQGVFGYDNSAFVSWLQDHGFYVASQSHSNYVISLLSIASSLNLDYLDQVVGPTTVPQQTLDALAVRAVGQSRARQFLAEQGYQFVSVASGWPVTAIRDRASDYHAPNVLSDFEAILLQNSAMAPLTGHRTSIPVTSIFRPYETERVRIRFSLGELGKIASAPGPKFVFAHVPAPHPPFVFGPNGEEVDPDRPFDSWDASYYTGSREEYLQGYRDEVIHLNRLVEQSIEQILANSSSSPIIILQGDHGARGGQGSKACLKQSMAILSAYRLPGAGAERLYPSITPVNSFRMVLDVYFGTHLGLLQDRAYFCDYFTRWQLMDVTSQVEDECQP